MSHRHPRLDQAPSGPTRRRSSRRWPGRVAESVTWGSGSRRGDRRFPGCCAQRRRSRRTHCESRPHHSPSVGGPTRPRVQRACGTSYPVAARSSASRRGDGPVWRPAVGRGQRHGANVRPTQAIRRIECAAGRGIDRGRSRAQQGSSGHPFAHPGAGGERTLGAAVAIGPSAEDDLCDHRV